jgi:DNA-binding protein HU-beta
MANKQDLVAIIAETGDLPKAKAGEVLDAVFEAITKSLKKKQDVRLVGFGTFSTSKRKAGKGRNPRTGEEIKIPATTTVRFKAGKGLKDALN